MTTPKKQDESTAQRHPAAIAWDAWLTSKEGSEARAANTLPHNTNHYLENRLYRAFMAGTKAVDQQRGLVIISALINFADWLNAEGLLDATEYDRGQLVLRFLAAHSAGENYFMQADQIAEMLGKPFQGAPAEEKACPHCNRVECECSDFDVSPDMGAKG